MNVQMKKIAVSMIAVGILFAIIGFASGGKWFILKGDSGFYVPQNQNFESKTFELEPFTNLNVSIGYGDVEIVPSNRFALEINANETSDITHEVKGDTLTINSDKTGGNTISIGIQSFQSPSIKLHVPKDTVLSNITLHASLGDVSFRQVSYKKLNLLIDYGDITFENVVANQTEITNSLGDVSLKNFSSKKLVLDSEKGDVAIEGILNGKTNITASLGDVTLDLENNKSELGYVLKTGLGDLTFNNEEHGSKLTQLYDGNNQLAVSLSLGDLDVSLK